MSGREREREGGEHRHHRDRSSQDDRGHSDEQRHSRHSHRHGDAEKGERHRHSRHGGDSHRHSHHHSQHRRSNSRSRSPARVHRSGHGHRGADPDEISGRPSTARCGEAASGPTPAPSAPPAQVAATALGAPPPVLISATDDFHRYATQFRLWLKQSRGLLLFDLPRERAREMFVEFAAAWNSGAVARELYREDLGATALASDTVRTAHQWNFATKSDAELDHLRSVGRAVSSLTNAAAATGPAASHAAAPPPRAPSGPAMPAAVVSGAGAKGLPHPTRAPIGPTLPPSIGPMLPPSIGPMLPPPRG